MRASASQIMRITSIEIYLGMFQRSTSTQNVYTAIACMFHKKNDQQREAIRTKDLQSKPPL